MIIFMILIRIFIVRRVDKRYCLAKSAMMIERIVGALSESNINKNAWMEKKFRERR